MKLALVQQAASPDREANLQRGIQAAGRAAQQGADVICFAELAFDRFYPQTPGTDRSRELAVPIPGRDTEPFSEIAREYQCVIVLNLYERCGEQTFDSSPLIDTNGEIAGITRMVHITDYPCFHEKDYYDPGDQGAPVYQTPHGAIGVAICYDRHFPEYMRALGVAGAQLVVVPQAGAVNEWPEGLFEAELRVAAFQNGYFTALCNRVGPEEQLTFAGESFVCDPRGTTIARAGSGTEETLICNIDLNEVDRSHARRLFMRDRRPEWYGQWIDRS